MRMTVERKMSRLLDFLRDNDIFYGENHLSSRCGVVLPIVLPRYRIVIHPRDDQAFYDAVKFCYKPVFVRDGESMPFTLRKLQNAIITQMLNEQKCQQRRNASLARR